MSLQIQATCDLEHRRLGLASMVGACRDIDAGIGRPAVIHGHGAEVRSVGAASLRAAGLLPATPVTP
jgi:hypothetical protein